MSRKLLLLLLSLWLSGCGFQMRGTSSLPPEMSRTYIEAADRHSVFYRKLRAGLQQAGVTIVTSPVDAGAVLDILTDATDQRVVTVSARNVPRQYEVYYTIRYALRAGEARLLEERTQTLTRDYTFDETLVLGKAREQEVLREALAEDLVRIVLTQLSSL